MTVFERILSGELSCHRLHEDEATFAFLDNGPVSRGHALLIPRTPAPTLAELTTEDGAALGAVIPRLSRALQAATGCGGMNLQLNSGELAGQEVPHLHFHFIPRYENEPGAGRVLRAWQSGELNHEDAAQLAAQVRENLKRLDDAS